MRLIFTSLLFSFHLIVFSQVDKKLINLNNDSTVYCLDSAEFSFGVLDFFSNRDFTKKNYGSPHKIENFPDYDTEKWIYDDFIIDFSNSGIYYITLQNSKLTTPSGIQIGMKNSDVFEILGETPDDKYFIDHTLGYEIQFANCDYEMYLVMKFNKENTLTNLELGIDLP